jgi:DNA polymerase
MSSLGERLIFELQLHRRFGLRTWPTATAVQPAPAPSAPEAADLTTSAQPAESAADRAERLQVVTEEILACTKCKLCETRTQAVPGEGSLDPPILFIGEGPGRDEDLSGRPFVDSCWIG